ncbi:Aste57867_23762 [Aphanomyces stellatus]|uniref:Aste57867_23762 protein n=1 Tax=Aphanomyces stellatus TaxID=120398 RepID=A0A485LT17_9STRA|nr:hypothetical protein As57867_023690 [Aphanomyces stellatus]VFU00407.1 Aste57867_23762 [Aphanomyces stellatus]
MQHEQATAAAAGDVKSVLLEWVAQEDKHETYCQHLVDYRKQKKAERAMLKQSLAILSETKAKLIEERRGILPWHEVASALVDVRRLSETQNKVLRKELQANESLLRDMHRWVSEHSAIQTQPNANTHTWRSVTLLANPESRLLGKEWIAKQMYHNMERMFERYHFPPEDSTEEYSTDEIVFDDDMDGSHGGYKFVQKRHGYGLQSFEQEVAYVKDTLLALQCSIPSYDPTLPKLVHDEGSIMQSAFVTAGNEYVNVLVGQFQTPDRYVFVVQQIQVDEAITQSVDHCRQRNRMIW